MAKKPVKTEVKSKPFASPNNIVLGMTLRDPITNLTGVAIMRQTMLAGTTQIAIQPPGEGNNTPEAMFIDDFLLEYVDDGMSARSTPIDPSVTISLGQHVQDILTGFEGIASTRVEYINGCVYFDVTPKAQEAKGKLTPSITQEGKLPSAHIFDHKRLKLVGAGLTSTERPQTGEPLVQKERGTGGPSMSVRSVQSRVR